MKYYIKSYPDIFAANNEAQQDKLLKRCDDITAKHTQIFTTLINRLEAGEISFFYQESKNNIVLWTRSPRAGVNWQESHIQKDSGQLIPVYHANLNTVKDIINEAGYIEAAYIMEG